LGSLPPSGCSARREGWSDLKSQMSDLRFRISNLRFEILEMRFAGLTKMRLEYFSPASDYHP
jgi:hypothetical protein